MEINGSVPPDHMTQGRSIYKWRKNRTGLPCNIFLIAIVITLLHLERKNLKIVS